MQHHSTQAMDTTEAASMFQRCLERCARATPPRGCGAARQAAVAASCLLRLGHAGKALKLASRALFLQPKDEHRQLVRQCTKELEYQGRAEAMRAALADCASVAAMPGAAGIMARLLQQLQQEGEEGAAEALRTLAKELVRGNVDAQIAFELLGGYKQVLLYWTSSLFTDAAQVLVSAGICQLHTVLQASNTVAEVLAIATGSGQAGKRNSMRVRWPPAVLQQLVATATTPAQANEEWSGMAELALRLVTVAALDPHQRQLGLSACSPTGSYPCSEKLSTSSQHPAPDTGTVNHCTPSPVAEDADPVSDVLSLLVDQLEASLCTPEHDSLLDSHMGPAPAQDTHGSPQMPQRRVIRSESAIGMQTPEREDSAIMHEPPALEPCLAPSSESSASEIWPAMRSGESLLAHVLGSASDAPWFVSLPSQGKVLLSHIVNSYACGSKFDRLVLRQALEKRGTLATLLSMYQAMRLDSSGDAASDTCGRLLLASLLNLCRHEPSLLRSEGFACRQRSVFAAAKAHRQTRSEDWASIAQQHTSSPSPSSTSTPSQTVLVPTPLLGQLIHLAKEELKHTSLEASGFRGDSCAGNSPFGPSTFLAHGGAGASPSASSSMVEGWVSLLTAVVQASRVNARELHRCHLLEYLQEVSESSSAPSLAQVVEAAYGMCAKQCQEMTQAMFDSKSVTALLGMARYSGQPSLALVALDRLTPLVSRCSSADYHRIVNQPGGSVLASAHQLMLMSLSARKAQAAADQASSSGGGALLLAGSNASASGIKPAKVHPWDAALTAATEAADGMASSAMAFGAAFKLPAPPPVPDFSLPQTGALRDAAQCLLLACLDRSRRQFGLKPMQAPRDGYWATVRPRDLLMLERRLREDWATAMLPKLAWQPAVESGDVPCGGNGQAASAPSLGPARHSAGPRAPAFGAVYHASRGTSACSSSGGQALDAPKLQEALIAAAPAAEEAAPGSSEVADIPAPRAPDQAQECLIVVSTDPASVPPPEGMQFPVPLLRSRRSDSLEDTAHKDSCHSSLRMPLGTDKVALDLPDAPDAPDACLKCEA